MIPRCGRCSVIQLLHEMERVIMNIFFLFQHICIKWSKRETKYSWNLLECVCEYCISFSCCYHVKGIFKVALYECRANSNSGLWSFSFGEKIVKSKISLSCFMYMFDIFLCIKLIQCLKTKYKTTIGSIYDNSFISDNF